VHSKSSKIWALQYRIVVSTINEMGRSLEPNKLDAKAFFVLQEIEKLAYPAAVAESLCMPKPTVSTYIKRLEAEALVKREIEADDLRRYRLTLTAKGKKTLETCQSTMMESFGGRLKKLKETEISEFYRLLTLLNDD
jgi:DNA-binding MarR family transcriptional regulator